MPKPQLRLNWQVAANRGLALAHMFNCPEALDRAAWSPTGDRIAIGYPNKKIEILDVLSGDVVRELLLVDPREYVHINTLAWSSDGEYIAAAYQDEYVRVWQASTGAYYKTLARHILSVNSIAWSPSSYQMVSTGADRFLLLWDVETGAVLKSFGGHHREINRVAWSHVGDRFASAGADGQILIWHATDGRLLMKLAALEEPINAIAWSRDDRRIVAATADRTVRVYDVETGVVDEARHGHSLSVRDAALSRNYPLMASKSQRERKIIIWRTDTLSKLAEITEPKSRYYGPAPSFHPVTPQLMTLGDNDSSVAIWELDLNQLFAAGEGRLADLDSRFAERARIGDFDVFLSYNSADRPAVASVAEDLLDKGVLPFFDKWHLPAGEQWQTVLADQISKIKVAAVFLGTHGRGPWQEFEATGLLDRAARGQCKLIPVVLPGYKSEPGDLFLNRFQSVDFNRLEDAPLEQLVNAITAAKTAKPL